MKRIQKVDKHFGKQTGIFYDKIAFSQELKNHGIRTPKIYSIMKTEDQWDQFWAETTKNDTFVLKPNSLSRGRGVHVLTKTDNSDVYTHPDGSRVAVSFLKTESVGFVNHKKNWHMMSEERILSDSFFNDYKVGDGIVDFRIYILDDKVLYAKMRCPTRLSHGLANTSRKGIAMFVSDGKIIRTDKFKNCTTIHPDIGIDRDGYSIEYWPKIIETATKVAKIFDSPFHSVDLTVNQNGEVVVIEAEKIPTLGHFSAEESKYLYDEIGIWMRSKLFAEMR